MDATLARAFDRSGKTVVVIDDDNDLAEVLAMLLQAEGYAVEYASTGKTGIALVARLGASAVLLDYMLPDMTGAEVGEKLRSNPALKGMKILMCTSTPEELVSPDFSDYDAFLRKPVPHTRLMQALDGALTDT